MAPNGLTIMLGVGSLFLGFASILLAIGGSLAGGLVVGVIVGVLLSPWVGRACAWLHDYLRR
jgi:hypothetical protein